MCTRKHNVSQRFDTEDTIKAIKESGKSKFGTKSFNQMHLYDIAHSRAGDKGNTLTLSLIPYKESDYEMLCREITTDKVKTHLKDIVAGEIVRYELPNIHSLLFVCQKALLGGVTTSLAIDTHGKALSYALLEMEF